MQLMNTMR